MSDNPPAMHLLERQQQLETLAQTFAEARAGSGKLLLIAGEAGLGRVRWRNNSPPTQGVTRAYCGVLAMRSPRRGRSGPCMR